jgi:hypothetical protein
MESHDPSRKRHPLPFTVPNVPTATVKGREGKVKIYVAERARRAIRPFTLLVMVARQTRAAGLTYLDALELLLDALRPFGDAERIEQGKRDVDNPGWCYEMR